MLTCPRCRHVIDVPHGHMATTIRCAICWAEVPTPVAEKPVTAAMLLDEPEPAAKTNPFSGVPGKTVKGMAPLEGMLRRIHKRAPHLLLALPSEETPPPPVSEPAKPRIQRPLETDLRRKRGETVPESEAEEPRSNGPMVMIAVLVFIATFVAILFLR